MAVQQRTIIKTDFRFDPRETGSFRELFWSLIHPSANVAKFVRLTRTRMADACNINTSCHTKLTAKTLNESVLSTAETYSWYVGSNRILDVSVGIGAKPESEPAEMEDSDSLELTALLDSMRRLDGVLVESDACVIHNRFLSHVKRLVESADKALLNMRFAFTKNHLIIEFDHQDISDFGAKILLTLFKDQKSRS